MTRSVLTYNTFNTGSVAMYSKHMHMSKCILSIIQHMVDACKQPIASLVG